MSDADVRPLSELTRGEARDGASSSLLLLPLGATEQHGPHLPVGTDSILVEEVARRAAARLAGEVPVVVAPALHFGSSAHHLPFGGTLSLETETYYRVLMDLGRSAVASGFRRLFLLNGHGGNHELAQLAARDLALSHPIDAGAGSWWTMAHDELIASGAWDAHPVPGHAGAFETSAVLALRPELVREPRPARPAESPAPAPFRAPYRAEFHGSWQAIDGHSDSPADATATAGHAALDIATRVVVDALRSFFAQSTARAK
jgi:creatinine amidohydrolase